VGTCVCYQISSLGKVESIKSLPRLKVESVYMSKRVT
jgi:hypothetical protein